MSIVDENKKNGGMGKREPHIALLLMCKNEKKRLHVTLESVVGFVDSIVAYDTGSTDNTIEILQNFSKKTGIPLRLKQGEFVDFSTSRNVSLEFADTFLDIDYLLLLDVNDELKGGDALRKITVDYMDKPNTGFLLVQEWFCGQHDKYFNVRLIKVRNSWRYKGRVHEYISDIRYTNESDAPAIVRIEDGIILYQDRTQDDDKSGKRFARDKVLLLEEYKSNPTETRTLFYLAQTCGCLNQTDDAYYFYKLRSTLEGFWEEKFQSFLRCGQLSINLGHPWHDSMIWFIKAYELCMRVEPLMMIANHYRAQSNWLFAYTYINLACLLKYPEHCILFVDKQAYDYTRWHLLGVIAHNAGFISEGRVGCIKAIEYNGQFNDLDKDNLKYYVGGAPPTTLPDVSPVKITKNKFIEMKISELQKENPKMCKKKILSLASLAWKSR